MVPAFSAGGVLTRKLRCLPRGLSRTKKVEHDRIPPSENRIWPVRYLEKISGFLEVTGILCRSHLRIGLDQNKALDRHDSVTVRLENACTHPRLLSQVSWLSESQSMFLASTVTLYFELLVIRYLPSEVCIFTNLKNLPLVASFFGTGLGMLLGNSRMRLK